MIASPEPDALREASYFVERLREEQMPLAGLVVNRASHVPPGSLTGDQAVVAAEKLDRAAEPNGSVTAGLLRLHADRARTVARESHLRRRFAAAHPQVHTAVIPALATDVHDLDGLRLVGDLLGAD